MPRNHPPRNPPRAPATSPDRQMSCGDDRSRSIQVIVFGVCLVVAGVAMGLMSYFHDGEGLLTIPLPFVGVGGVAIVSELWFQRVVKHVWLGDHGLRVANRHDEIFVPYETIKTVSQQWHNRKIIIVIRLRQDSAFGRRFAFLPVQTLSWNGGWGRLLSGDHEVVTDLRERVTAARFASRQKRSG